MKWVKFFLVSLVIYVVLWALCGYAYGTFSLSSNVVPDQGVAIDEWVAQYYVACLVSAIIGLVVSTIWFYMGITYMGSIGVSTKYYLLWFVSLALALVAGFFLIYHAQDGAGASLVLCTIISPIGFYINSLVNSAQAVKYIPPLADKLHG